MDEVGSQCGRGDRESDCKEMPSGLLPPQPPVVVQVAELLRCALRTEDERLRPLVLARVEDQLRLFLVLIRTAE